MAKLVKQHYYTAKGEKKVLDRAYNVFEWAFLIAVFVIYTVTFVMIMPFISIYTRNMTDVNYILPILGYLFVLVGIVNNVKIILERNQFY